MEIIEELESNRKHEMHCVGMTPRTNFNGTQKEHDDLCKKNANDYEKAINILKENKYIVRDWMTADVFEFDDYETAKNKYNEILSIRGELDVQFYKIIESINNVD